MNNKYISYVDKSIEELLYLLSQNNVSTSEKEDIINRYCDELNNHILSCEGIKSISVISNESLCLYTDKLISQEKGRRSLSDNECDHAIDLCRCQANYLSFFESNNIPVPHIVNNDLKSCITYFEKTKEKNSYQRAVKNADNRVSELIASATILSPTTCDEIIAALNDLKSKVNECRSKGYPVPEIKHNNIEKEVQSFLGSKDNAKARDQLYSDLYNMDLQINTLLSQKSWTADEYRLIAEKIKCLNDLIEKCNRNKWSVPQLRTQCGNDEVNRFQHYRSMLLLDESISDSLTDTESQDMDQRIISLCTNQKNNIAKCQTNKWRLPQLVNTNLDQLITKANASQSAQRFKHNIKKGLIIAAICAVLILALVISGIISYRKSRIRVPFDSDYAVGEKYEEIVDNLKSAGFKNIKAESDKTGWFEDGTVIGVVIDNDKTFSKSSYYKPDVNITVKYSSTGRKDITNALAGWTGLNVNDLKKKLNDAGIKNVIVTNRDITDDVEKDQLACRVIVNGVEYKTGKCFIPSDAQIQIEYYSFKIRINKLASDYIGKNYQDQKNDLEKMGFKKIQVDSVSTGWKEANTIVSITIDNKTNFQKDDLYDPNVLIVIKYSSNDRKDLTSILENWQNRSISDVESKLKGSGFSNIKKIEEVTGDKSKNNLVKAVVLNKENYQNGICQIQIGAPIELTYYSYKIVIGKTADDFMKNKKGEYKNVVEELKKLGFTNIVLKRADDLTTGWISKEGSLESITIAGDSKFTKESAFYPSDSIVIVVHTFKNKGCEDITQKK